MWWLNGAGFFDQTVDTLPSPRAKFAANAYLSGRAGGRSLNLHQFARDGIVLLGRLQGIEGSRAMLAPDLGENLAKADAFAATILKGIDDTIQTLGLPTPEDPATREAELAGGEAHEEILELDLERAGISAIIWATGYNFDFSWIKVPVLDSDGYPVQQRGVTGFPGLYFLGLPWLYKRKSGLFLGVGEDAEHITAHIAKRD